MENIIEKAKKLKLWNSLDTELAYFLSSKNSIKKYNNALILAISCLSANINIGHSCLPLKLLCKKKFFLKNYPELSNEIFKKLKNISSLNDWKSILLSTSVVSDTSLYSLSPLILDNNCLYFHRIWEEECLVAKFFSQKTNKINTFKKNIVNTLNQLFPNNTQKINLQKIAVAIGLIHQISIISGGPGTGKTSTIAKLMLSFLLCNTNYTNLNIKMSAPTGKSAAQLTQTFNTIIRKTDQFKIINKNYLPQHAITLHQLLKFKLNKVNPFFNSKNPLPIDILIIDEASMISLSMMAKIILALPNKAKIVLIGDHFQLPSIEPGSIFYDLCQFSKKQYSYEQNKILSNITNYIFLSKKNKLKEKKNYNIISDKICILKENYRFSKFSNIHQLAMAINSGNYHNALSLLETQSHKNIHYIHIENKKNYLAMIINCTKFYLNYFKNIKNFKICNAINFLKSFHHHQILCAINHSIFGVEKINYYIEQILIQDGLIQLTTSKNYLGRPIIILKNEYSLKLFNGDIGILLLNSEKNLSAYFLDSNNTVKIVPLYQLPKHETCFAMTIHKSQGSEFKNVTIILPNQYCSILTRELLYSAITRSRQNLFIYAKNNIIKKTIKNKIKRYSGLPNKINTYMKNSLLKIKNK